MIIITNGNNPTGAYMTESYLNELITIARKYDLYILCDEVYHSFSSTRFLAVADYYDKGISTNSMSKTFSLPGIRVGWLLSSSEICRQLQTYRDYTMISAGVISDQLATLALQAAAQILDRNQHIIEKNLAILDQWVSQEEKVSYIKPNQVSIAFVKLNIQEDIQTFANDLLAEYGTLVVPGTCFGQEGYIRIGYGCSTECLEAGLLALSQKLKNIQYYIDFSIIIQYNKDYH